MDREARPAYRPEIDGLRALAVTAVIINHFDKNILPSGYLGVDIFFVISGFVITSSLVSRPSKNLGDLLAGFYARRVKRLLPALVLFVVVMSLLICLFDPKPSESLNTGLASLFGLSNIYLLQQSTDYFAPSTQLNVFTHTWSLGVEEQFYLIFPLLFWYAHTQKPSLKLLIATAIAGTCGLFFLLVSKLTTGSSLGLLPGGIQMAGLLAPHLALGLLVPIVATFKFTRNRERNFIIVITLLSMLSLAAFLSLFGGHQPAAYFLMPTRFWELGAGCLLFLGLRRGENWLSPLRQLPPLLVLLVLGLALLLPLERGQTATWAVVSLTVCLIACLRPGTVVYNLFTHKGVVKVGLISYSLYLWHWGVLALSRWTVGIHALSIPLQLSLMLLLALISYHYIETPLRQASWSTLRWRTITYGAGLSISAASFLGLLILFGKELSLDRRFPSTWSASLEHGGQDFVQQSQLQNRVDSGKMVATLTLDELGRELPNPRAYVLGDSHSNHYVTALKKTLTGFGVGSASVGWRCGYVSPLDIDSQTKQWMSDCERYPEFINQFLTENLHSGDVVILGQRWKEKKTHKHMTEALQHLARITRAKGASLILIDDVPELEVANPLLCERRPWRPFSMIGCLKTKAAVDSDQNPLDKMMLRIAADNDNVRYISLRHLYCRDEMCGPYLGKMLLYKDTDHLSSEASLLGAAMIAGAIHKLERNPQPWTMDSVPTTLAPSRPQPSRPGV